MQAVLLLVIVSVVGQSMQEGQKLCGRNLAISLAALCRAQREKQLGQYITSPKRSRYSILPYYAPYWLEPESALRLGRGKRDGIVEECCNKACSVDELLAYCPPQ
ncbi:bombyxin A-2 homolog [Cydia pomonella]|uniref:bombyxin A-2 homolog n=1 Tax=Cydia pomonella TaxID=82600 RepID=UPI002ADDE5A9|nr:bombyxin A-2 homolog [Cydia pomonella]